MKILYILIFCLISITVVISEGPASWNAETPLSTVLIYLGDPQPDHSLPKEKQNQESVERGRNLFERGYVDVPGKKKPKPQSKFFTCTDCHNSSIEDTDLRVSDPEKRFSYIWDQGIPLLQGTTVKGVVNKTSWYNGDYQEKYGDLVKSAQGNLREAIQLCARECSQGREFTSHELDEVVAYFWSLQYTLGDLKLSEEDYTRLNNESQDKEKHRELAAWLKGFYLSASPATFGDLPKDPVAGYGLERSYDRGEKVYKLSCLHCHAPGRILKWPYVFKYNKHTFGFLSKHFPRDHHFSPYNALRKGTYTSKKKKLYMPNFTLEKMSDQQIEDLREFVTNYLRRQKEGKK